MGKLLRPIRQILNLDGKKLNAYSVGLLQGKAYRILSRYLTDTLAWYGLSMNEWKLLGQLYDHGEMTRSEMGKRLSVDNSTLKKLLKRLTAMKYITSTKKNTYIILPKAKELLPLLETAVKEKMSILLTGISKVELLIYIKVLEKIVNNGVIENK